MAGAELLFPACGGVLIPEWIVLGKGLPGNWDKGVDCGMWISDWESWSFGGRNWRFEI
jgi:hypothetical protein